MISHILIAFTALGLVLLGASWLLSVYAIRSYDSANGRERRSLRPDARAKVRSAQAHLAE